jgi:hypothetical protein
VNILTAQPQFSDRTRHKTYRPTAYLEQSGKLPLEGPRTPRLRDCAGYGELTSAFRERAYVTALDGSSFPGEISRATIGGRPTRLLLSSSIEHG